MTQTITPGAFIRVRADHDDSSRAGFDGLVLYGGQQEIGLLFGLDRFGRDQYIAGLLSSRPIRSEGVEAWQISELDLATLET